MAGMNVSPQRNVLGEELQPCGTDPVTGFLRDGSCHLLPDGGGVHTICTVVTEEFLEHQVSVGNDLVTPRPEWGFPGLVPGDRWCVVAHRWRQAFEDGYAAPVVLAATNVAALEVVPMAWLAEHAVDVPDDLSALFEE